MPVFPLKGQDALALETIVFYRDRCRAHGLTEQANQVQLAIDEMLAWQMDNPGWTRLPDHQHSPAGSEAPPAGWHCASCDGHSCDDVG